MSIYKELSYDNYIEQVKSIRFCILSPNEIKRMSVAEITKTDTYLGTEPVINGLFDPRMGVLDHNKVCHTCEQKNTFCPGHFGHIVLAKPVFYIQFFDIVRKILKCVCWRCSKLLIDPNGPLVKGILSKKYSRQKRWELMYKLCSKVRRCGQETLDGCKAKQPEKIYREPIVKIVMEWKDLDSDKEELKKQVLDAEDVLRILQRITDDDAEVLGFHRKYNRPEWMICTVLPVPPPAVRPSVRTDTGLRSEDDLTHKLCDIVKNNNTLKSKIDKQNTKEQIDIATQVLQYHVATFIDNNIPGINPAQQRTGRLLKSLTERLKSKEGRIRGNLMGKRVDFSARSVITPDPNISIDELGVPIKIAMNLTFPEVVNKYNIEKLTALVRNGPDIYPGAKCLRQGNRTFLLKNKDRNTIELKEGDVVERHMMNGDYVLFNRQPSLHRMSMMGHRVVVMPYNTFRSNPSVCPCFNSDYDGDEMNAHLPQSVVTMNELIQLAAVPTQIISPRECKPIISIVQDVPLGVYRLTKSHVMMNQKQLFNLMSLNPRYLGYVPEPAANVNGVDKWSGRQILSTIIPKNINIKSANKSFDGPHDKENYVVIQNGEIKQGIVDKKIYQSGTSGLIHSIFNECGPDETRMFFDNTQRIICDWLVMNGFSVGISDLTINETTQNNLEKTIHNMKVKVYDILSQVHTGNFENKSIVSNNDYFEDQVNKILNQASSDAGAEGLANINDITNRMINMIRSGSKGNPINVAQMIACLGQVNVEGKRIAYGFENRTLPHYAKFDDGPESRGFVQSSFIKGLNPQEFFFHSMGGREGLIDTAVRTSETGYLQRKLVKAMEDCKISYDHTVRNASGTIVQFLYGEDGMDPIKLEDQQIPYIDMDYTKLRDTYLLTEKDDIEYILDANAHKEFTSASTFKEDIQKYFDHILEDRLYFIQKIFNNRYEKTIKYPVSFQRIITNARAMFPSIGVTDLSPAYVLKELNKLCETVYVTKVIKGNMFFQMLARAYLGPKQVLMEYKFDKATFDLVIQQIKHRFYDAIAHPSEMVGVISAQSIGEPCTQMSSSKTTRIMVMGDNNFTYSGTIGEFIDGLLEKHKDNVHQIGHDSVVLDLEDSYNIIGVSNEEKTSWKRISQISRHPANGGLVKVYTRSGKTTTATLTHSFLKRTETGIAEVKGSDLCVGQRIPVAKCIPEVENALVQKHIGELGDVVLDRDFGWLCGAYIADGFVTDYSVSISKVIPEYRENIARIVRHHFGIQVTEKYNKQANFKEQGYEKQYNSIQNIFNNKSLAGFFGTNFGKGSENKCIPAWVFGANKKFIAGLLQGYFDGDGNVNGDAGKCMIRAGSISENLISDIIILLAYFGIFGSKCLEVSKTGKVKKTFHTIQISRKYSNLFKDQIGFVVHSKTQNLEKIISYMNTPKKQNQEYIDKIPCVVDIITSLVKDLKISDKVKYISWKKKGVDSIGRTTLIKYIHEFKQLNETLHNTNAQEKITLLEQAAFSDVIWDEIVKLEYLDDPKEFVYDFTVPGNDSFMVDTCILVHNTLNTFHLSGVSSASKAVRGVPRMKELMSVTKNIKAPALTIYLDERIRKDKTESKKVLTNIQTTYFKDIVKHSKIYFDPEDFNTTIDDDRLFLDTYREFIQEELMQSSELTPWLLRFEFDKEKMKEFEVTMQDLSNVIYDYYKETVNCMFSDDTSQNLIMRVKLPETKDEDKDIVTELKALEKNILENIIVNGVKKINKVVMNNHEYNVYNEETMVFEKTNEWIMETNGTNLLDILGHKHVDPTRTVSNDVTEIYELLGVEAARQALYNEIWDVIKNADLYVNYRHISLLVDTMTNKGYLLSVDRHGINRVDIGPLAKCSFEEVTDMLVKAGIFSEVDKISGVSSNIMLGQIPPYGTGDTDVLIDEDKLIELVNTMNTEIDGSPVYNDDIADYTIDKDAMCDMDAFHIDFDLPERDNTIEKLNIPVIVTGS